MDRKTSYETGDVSHDDAVALFSMSNVAMVLTNPLLDDNPIIYVNRAFEALTGYTSEIAVGQNCRFLQGKETSQQDVRTIRKAIEAEEDLAITILNHRADGSELLNALLISPVREDGTGRVIYFLGLQMEVNQDRQAERLAEFENLVGEIQHRVKNHLATILSLIRMKSREMDDTSGLNDVSRRIESLQLLYEEMSAARENSNEDKIQLGSFLGRVANAIAHLDGRAGVRMNVNVEPLVVETETAVRIGLVISEVLTNAMQHAFVDQKSGLVELKVTRTDDGGMRAIVTDDGVGLPDDVEWPNSDGLGGRIVDGLCVGLNATLNVGRGAVGTVITLDVPSAD